jgi:hypothetical protein
MSPEEEQRLFDARLSPPAESCEDVVPKLVGDVDPIPTVADCEPPADPPVEIFFPPNDPPPEDDDERELPAPIIVEGAAFSLACVAPQVAIPEGALPITYTKGEIVAATQLVYLDAIPTIPTGELYRISPLVSDLAVMVADDLADLVSTGSDWVTFDATIVNLLGVLPEVAVDIREALVAAQLRANDIVETVAVVELRCVWPSRQLRAYCDTDSPVGYRIAVGPDLPPPGVDSAEVAAGVATSGNSQAEADAKAGRIAARELTCLFLNVTQTVTCAEVEGGAFEDTPMLSWPADGSDEALRSPALIPLTALTTPPYGPTFYVADTLPDTRTLKLTSTVTSGSVTGRTQEEADETALLLARAELDCFFPSRPRIFSCVDDGDYGNAAANAELVGGRSEEHILNEMATGSIAGVRVDNVGVVANAAIDTTVGVRTKLPAGMFVGATAGEAEDLAEAFALSTLECLWGNVELTYACDDLNSDPSEPSEVALHRPGAYPGELDPLNKQGQTAFSSALGKTLDMLASPRKSDPYVNTVLERQFLSDTGQDDANESAAAFAVSQLGCVYCNPRIPPVCVTFVTHVPPHTPDNVELPVNATLLTPNQSSDATSGVPGVAYATVSGNLKPPVDYLTAEEEGSTFTCGDFAEAVAVADVVGAIPIRDLVFAKPAESCLYGNDRVYAACALPVPIPEGFTAGDFQIPAYHPDPVVSASYAPYLSPNSTAGYIVVVENTFQEAGDAVTAKAAANALAEAHALSQLNCFFESPALKLFCGANTSSLNPGDSEFPSAAAFTNPDHTPVQAFGNGKFGVGGTTEDPGEYVHKKSIGYKRSATITADPERPVTLKYGLGFSEVSPQDALAQALFIGLGQLDCFFMNTVQSAACDVAAPAVVGGVTIVSTYADEASAAASVPADIYPSDVSQLAADTLAILTAEASLLCLYTHAVPATDDTCVVNDEVLVKAGFVPAKSIVSAVSSVDAYEAAKSFAESLVYCAEPDTGEGNPTVFSSPFGVGTAAGACCNVQMLPGIATELTTIWVCNSAGDDPPTPTNISCQEAAANIDMCAENGFVYLELEVERTEHGETPDTTWAIIGSPSINFSTSSVDTLDGGGDAFTVRRVIAQVVAGGSDTCAGTQILQAVGAPQKMTTTLDENGDKVPVIADLHTPTAGGGTGSGSSTEPFQLVASGAAGDNILKVRESTLAGEVPSGFTAGIMDLTIADAADAAGVVYAKLTINGTTGAVTARAVEKAASLPANTSTVFHELIGSYTVTGSGGSAVIAASNARYGPIPATICRNWFAAEAPFYAVSFG